MFFSHTNKLNIGRICSFVVGFLQFLLLFIYVHKNIRKFIQRIEIISIQFQGIFVFMIIFYEY